MRPRAHSLALHFMRSPLGSHSCASQDCQIVSDATARGAHALLRKHLMSVGCKTWQRKCTNASVLDAYTYTSDRGLDQACVRSIMQSQTQDDDSVVFIDWGCTLHAVQLIIKAGLVIVENFWKSSGRLGGYFSGVAKYINVWREYNRSFASRWRQVAGTCMCVKNGPAKHFRRTSEAQRSTRLVRVWASEVRRKCFAGPFFTHVQVPEQKVDPLSAASMNRRLPARCIAGGGAVSLPARRFLTRLVLFWS